METAMFILTVIGTIATVISTFSAIRAKNEAKIILKEIKDERNRNVDNYGRIKVDNTGVNTGIISGVNTGEVHGNVK